jgi:membrane fusion protein (multidrug efflux system)
VTKLHFESGQTVKKDDLLLELNTSTDQAELNGFIASEKLAKIKLKRQATLLKSKATSQSSYDEARANLDLAHADVIAKKSVLDKKILRAPFNGVIGIRQVSLGEYIDKGHQIAPLVSLANTIADFTLPERNYADINVGQLVQITVQAYPNELFEGVIRAINPGLHEQTRTVSVRALINNPEHKLRAGMFADIKIIISKPKPVITLPETAVLFNTYGESVYIVINKDGKNTVEQRRIETGKRLESRIEIISGLVAGDTVVDEGHVKLRNGLAITIANDNNP